MMTDIEIAQQCAMKPITEIAVTAHVDEKYLEQYGRYKAKIDLSLLRESKRPDGKLILVTAITPTPAGEGKTTTTIGLADGLRRIGKDVTVALREPSLGPVFGIKGGEDLAREVVRLCDQDSSAFSYSYPLEGSIDDKINAIVQRIYGGDGISVLPAARKQIDRLTALGFGNLPVCMAKTQYSFSDDAAKLGAPEHFTVTIRNVKVSAGAGFIVALTGDIMTMPGLPKVPAAERIDVDENGVSTGLC